jgi:4-alpha-glucanotransferase
MANEKEVGILCHLTSLPNSNLGEDGAIRFCEFLNELGVTVWQMLPLHPPDQYGSPYSSSSAFAGWEGYLHNEEKKVDLEDFKEFKKINSFWLDDFALFKTLKMKFNNEPWSKWPLDFRNKNPQAISQILDEQKEKINSIKIEQYLFDKNWNRFHNVASNLGIRLFGDIPFFVSHDSADVWASPNRFELEPNGQPTHVSGVPPDYFSPTGQRWGTPLYRWESHKSEEYKWWKNRMKRMFQLFDIVRIDHFRAIDSAWSIPAHHPTAEYGSWVKGPGSEFLEEIIPTINGEIVAEDLGIIPKSVSKLREKYGLPGMAILQFANEDKNNPHRPENHTKDTVVYTGTHDNDTTVGWGKKPLQDTMMEALNSVANLAIFPLQDILGLGTEARMNTPGTVEGNWSWRFNWDDLENEKIEWFKEAARDSGRLN